VILGRVSATFAADVVVGIVVVVVVVVVVVLVGHAREWASNAADGSTQSRSPHPNRSRRVGKKQGQALRESEFL